LSLGQTVTVSVRNPERIIKASSNEGDIVLRAFCGCGTAVVAAQTLKRQWIGIDASGRSQSITNFACNLIPSL
jgi:DNA modification methylase